MSAKPKKSEENSPSSAKTTGGHRKLAIVMSGGGMRCVYGVGVLTALVEEYGLTQPDILITASGSTGPATYYLSGQYYDTISVFLAVLSGKHFISYRRRKVIDIDYLVDEIFKKEHPLDFGIFNAKKTRLLYTMLRVSDGATVYLEPPRDERIYEYLRAAKAIPLVYGKKVRLGKEDYIDGAFGAHFEDMARQALAEGAEDIILIDSSPETDTKSEAKVTARLIEAEALWRKERGITEAARRKLENPEPLVVPPAANVVSLKPSKGVSLGTLSRKKFDLRVVFNEGYADAANDAGLRALLASRSAPAHAPRRRRAAKITA